MIPAKRCIKFDFILLLIIIVSCQHLACIQTIAATEATPWSTATEATVAGIVRIAKKHKPVITVEISAHTSGTIPVFITYTEVDIRHQTLIHTFLHIEVEHGLFLTIINTRHLREITFLIVSLDLINNTGWQVLEGSLGISGHKLLTVNEDFLHLLTIDFDGTVIAHLSTRQTFHKLFYHRTFWSTVGSRIIYEGILLERYFLSHSGNHSPFQHDGISTDDDITQCQILVLFKNHTLHGRLISDTRNLQKILAIFRRIQMEKTFLVADGTRHIGAIGFEQLDGHLLYRILGIPVDNRSAYQAFLSKRCY